MQEKHSQDHFSLQSFLVSSMGCSFADPSVYPLIFNPNNPKRKLRYALDKR